MVQLKLLLLALAILLPICKSLPLSNHSGYDHFKIVDNLHGLHDAADLLECSKYEQYAFFPIVEFSRNESNFSVKPLTSVLLSSQFFAIVEAIAGTSGNFIKDSIVGPSIARAIDSIKEMDLELLVGTLNNINTSHQKQIFLACQYGIYPNLNNYFRNNFCEYLGFRQEEKHISISEGKICNYLKVNFLNYKEHKYFNTVGSLTVPILNTKYRSDIPARLFGNLDFINNNYYGDTPSYPILSKEFDLLPYINFGFDLLDISDNKYWGLIRLIPPKSFWEKDLAIGLLKVQSNTESQDISNITTLEMNDIQTCTKYEQPSLYTESDTYIVTESLLSSNITVNKNLISYIKINMAKVERCSGGWNVILYFKKKVDIVAAKINMIDKFKVLQYNQSYEDDSNTQYNYQYYTKLPCERLDVAYFIVMKGNDNKYIKYSFTCDKTLINTTFPILEILKNVIVDKFTNQKNIGKHLYIYLLQILSFSFKTLMNIIVIFIYIAILLLIIYIVLLILKKFNFSIIENLYIMEEISQTNPKVINGQLINTQMVQYTISNDLLPNPDIDGEDPNFSLQSSYISVPGNHSTSLTNTDLISAESNIRSNSRLDNYSSSPSTFTSISFTSFIFI
ncbi:hypothetical protein cand_035270 [Cryptosporidium andersoni]|uniref:Uncharacterized protein n=1 Tax=Cryptosporidium andersoni TaxID=117008 RepID=A0A1J4MVN9_9CRYT|nr:hypothetical protein cand_035270 [Cryptosporidium andersoni]